jgi:hypothetical protein
MEFGQIWYEHLISVIHILSLRLNFHFEILSCHGIEDVDIILLSSNAMGTCR